MTDGTPTGAERPEEPPRDAVPADERPTVLPADSGVAPVPVHGGDAPDEGELGAEAPGAGASDSGADSAATDREDGAGPADAPPGRGPRGSRPGAGRGGSARRAAVTGIRLATGALGVAIAVGVLVAVAVVPIPSIAVPVPGQTVRPVPAPLSRVCPGAILALGDTGGGDAATAAPVGRATVVARADGDQLDRTTLAPSASAAQLLTSAPGALLAGAQSQTVATDDLRGLAAAPCSDPAGTSWLVAGATTTGRTTLLELMNPTRVDAIVELRIWTEQGRVDAPGLRGIVVPAGAQKVLSLAGYAQNAAAPVVRVSSRGGRVVATAQESILRVVDPGGIDLATPSTAGTRLVIPGVTIATATAVSSLRGRAGYEDLQPVIRLLAPSGDTTARIRIRPEGSGKDTLFDVPVIGGKVLDVPIDGLAEGSYSVELSADAPIAAGVRASVALPLVGGDPLEAPRSDVGWFSPAPLLGSRTLFSAPAAPSRLHVANPGRSAVTLVAQGIGAADVSVQVPAGGSASVDLAASATYRVEPRSPVRLAVVAQTAGGIASYPVAPPPAASVPILIRR